MTAPGPSTTHTLSRRGRVGRIVLKRWMYAWLAVRQAVMIALGREQPLVRFTVEADPPSVYVVYELREDELDRLARRLALPEGTELAPIRCVEGDEPRYLLTLNYYRVSGLTHARRAEWSTYISEPDGTPRYLVVGARSHKKSMDPVDLLTDESRVDHFRTGDRVDTTIGEPGEAFTCTLDLTQGTPARSATEFVTANDYIYWTNGVCDRTFYDAGLADADMTSIPPSGVELRDETEWAPFVDPDPVAVLVYNRAIEFAMSPWVNLDAMHD